MALIPMVDVDFRWVRIEGTQSPRISLQYRTAIDILGIVTWGEWRDVQETGTNIANAIRELGL